MNGDSLEEILRQFLVDAPAELCAAYLYGSRARGTASDRSDLDLALLYRETPPTTLSGLPLDLESKFERIVGIPVQAVILNSAPPDLVHRVLRDGTLVLDRDPGRRIRFEVKSRNEFFDLKPVLDEYRAARAPAR